MSTINNERITTRVTTETKELLERAAALSGYPSLNSFIANAAVSEAKKLIEQDMVINLCRDDAIAFVEALERPAQVNNRFLSAARKYKETFNYANKNTQ